MRLHDPARPRLYYKPAYVSPAGKPIAPMPQLSIWPREYDTIDEEERLPPLRTVVGCWLLTASNQATLFSVELETEEDLTTFLNDWLTDPEAVMRDQFDYFYEPTITRLVRVQSQSETIGLTLEDLGL